jgi:hypothetical protein
LESGYFGIKAALLILKPALLILKCSLTLIPVGCQAPNNNSKKPRLHVRLVTGEPGFLMTSIIVSHNFPPPKTEDFLKYYINNKYKQLNIRTMAESFEGKK